MPPPKKNKYLQSGRFGQYHPDSIMVLAMVTVKVKLMSRVRVNVLVRATVSVTVKVISMVRVNVRVKVRASVKVKLMAIGLGLMLWLG